MNDTILPKKGLEFKLALNDEPVADAKILKKVLLDGYADAFWVLKINYYEETFNMPEVIIRSDIEMVKLLSGVIK